MTQKNGLAQVLVGDNGPMLSVLIATRGQSLERAGKIGKLYNRGCIFRTNTSQFV